MKEVLQQAIDFAEYCHEELDLSYMASNQAKRLIEKSKEALAKQEQGEPVLWAAKESMFMWGKSDESGHPYHIVCKGKKVKSHQIPLYTTPQQRTWVGLTDEEIEEIWGEDLRVMYSGNIEATKSIEAKLKEKNT